MKLKFKISVQNIKWLMIMIISSSTIAYGQKEKQLIREGNVKYNDGKYAESEVAYRKALGKNNISPDAGFNLGDALYKQKKYEEAGKAFLDNSQVTPDNIKKSSSFYNLGNSMLNNKKIQESIEAYENSLKLNPRNAEAKYNLAYAQDLLRMQQQQQQQQQKDQNKDKKDNKNKDKDRDNKQNNDNQNQKQDQRKNQQQISKEDAQRLLDAIANDEKKVEAKVNLEKASHNKIRTLINW